jgi:ABC-type bacteriocin/lantibiotic exporter with double-glycine peptidase domain
VSWWFFFIKEPLINSESTDGVKPQKLDGKIEFKKVYFNYPSRQDVGVLTNLSLEIEAGKTVALVVSSGKAFKDGFFFIRSSSFILA